MTAVNAVREIDTFLRFNPDGELLVDGVPARALAAEYGTPVHVISESRLRENFRRFRGAMTEAWTGGVRVNYAIKANPALAVARVLSQEGAGGDCLGLHELQAALIAGIPTAKLVLNGNNKLDAAIEAAVAAGARINVDDLAEIERVDEAARRAGTTAVVGIRLKLPLNEFEERVSELSGTTVRDFTKAAKWGLEPERAETAIAEIRRRPNLELHGLHCHLGRHFADPSLFGLLARSIAGIVVRLHERTGFTPRVLALGGGFTQGRDPFCRKPTDSQPWPQASDSFVEPIEAYAEALSAELQAALAAGDVELPELEFEPGRYVAASAGLTLTRVGNVKRSLDRTYVEVDTAITQIGVSRSPRDAHAVIVASRARGGAVSGSVLCDVVGPLCVVDVIMEQARLPEVERGDVLAVLDTGAYADGEASNANSIGRPAVVLTNDGRAELIRRRESFADVFVRDRIPPRLLGEPMRAELR